MAPSDQLASRYTAAKEGYSELMATGAEPNITSSMIDSSGHILRWDLHRKQKDLTKSVRDFLERETNRKLRPELGKLEDLCDWQCSNLPSTKEWDIQAAEAELMAAASEPNELNLSYGDDWWEPVVTQLEDHVEALRTCTISMLTDATKFKHVLSLWEKFKVGNLTYLLMRYPHAAWLTVLTRVE